MPCVKRNIPLQLFLVPNVGADTGAFLLHIKYLLSSKKQYDYVLKIHTKSSNVICPHWKEDLLEPIVGSLTKIADVFKLFGSFPEIGMICAHRWKIRYNLEW